MDQQSEKQNKIIKCDVVLYLLNEENKTGSVIGCHSPNYDISKYEVTCILSKGYGFFNESIIFPSESKLQMIDDKIFFHTSIVSITFPPKLNKEKLKNYVVLQYDQ